MAGIKSHVTLCTSISHSITSHIHIPDSPPPFFSFVSIHRFHAGARWQTRFFDRAVLLSPVTINDRFRSAMTRRRGSRGAKPPLYRLIRRVRRLSSSVGSIKRWELGVFSKSGWLLRWNPAPGEHRAGTTDFSPSQQQPIAGGSFGLNCPRERVQFFSSIKARPEQRPSWLFTGDEPVGSRRLNRSLGVRRLHLQSFAVVLPVLGPAGSTAVAVNLLQSLGGDDGGAVRPSLSPSFRNL